MRIDTVLRDLVTRHPDPPRPASAVRISRLVLRENAISVVFMILLLGAGGVGLLTEPRRTVASIAALALAADIAVVVLA